MSTDLVSPKSPPLTPLKMLSKFVQFIAALWTRYDKWNTYDTFKYLKRYFLKTLLAQKLKEWSDSKPIYILLENHNILKFIYIYINMIQI